MTKNNRKSAAFDNQVSAFLVRYCEELPEYEEMLCVMYRKYQAEYVTLLNPDLHDPYYKSWMPADCFRTRVEASGLTLIRKRTGRGIERRVCT